MELRVLVDNNTLIDRYFVAEPGLSFLIEDGGAGVLFDTGYSGVFIQNAARMGRDLTSLDRIVLSHGHPDHTWGLGALIRLYTEASIEKPGTVAPAVIGAPGVFEDKHMEGIGEIGSLLSEEKLGQIFPVEASAEPVRLTERLVFLGEIPRRFNFEASAAVGRIMTDAGPAPDPLTDDTALAYESERGLVVISGCAHAGICNTIEHAREVCGREKVADVIGGLHLLDAEPERMQGTARYLEGLQLEALHACHCTDLAAKIFLARTLPVREVGVGLKLAY
jgi:7,8-dihydropterin-6-yl-methyl-4-(beta-D-ribofuranosyl)aminobenzene 5'-phosphate synthase